MSTTTGLASMTPLTQTLPPSPEMKGMGALLVPPMDPLSLDGNDEQLHPMSRLRSIARYETFQPRALALSPPVPLSYTGFESSASQKPTGESSTIRRSPQADTNKGSGGGNSGGMTSLGAVAGSHGVALFRLTKPQVPILILSHASNSVLKSGAVSSLAFQPDNSRYMHLAAARGSGVLVWDVSGHTLSPLVGRVSSGLDDESQIISLAWKPSADGTPWLAATTSSSACLWDLREPSGYTMFKPSLRFGVTRKQGAGNLPVAPYVQVACSDRDECALLDAAGTLRVFDTRMTDRTRSSTGALSSFSSFQHAGVGLAYMQSESDDTHWVTWGLESSTSNAVVKVWRSCTESADSVVGDDYWLMDGLPERSSSGLKPFGYKLAGKCTTPNLACARVCPSPIKNSIVTVGLDQKEPGGPASWRADLWKLAEPANDSEESALVKIISFDGGRETDKHLSSMLGPDARQGLLRASELAFSSYPTFFQQLKGDKSKGVGKSEISSEFGLLLCNLSENGYITTHVIPEALPHDLTKDDEKVTPSAGEGSTHTRVFPTDNAAAIKDPARLWGSHGEMLTLGIDVRAGREHQDTSGAQAAFEGGMPFDMEVPVAYSIAAGGITGVQLAGVSDMTSSNIPQTGTSDSEDNDQTGADARAAVALMENIDADRIPCPRLCGAAFGTGIGGLVTFHNGEVGKMWQWFQQTGSNRLSAVPGSIGEPSVAATGGAEKAIELISQDGAGGGQATSKTCPRSLQDLIDMTSAAKEAQWGEQENDSEGGSSNNGRILGDNFFDDDSESSSEQPEDVSEDLGEGVDSKNKKALYESYFGDVRGATETGESAGESERKLSDRKTSNHVVGPSSDTLAPVVQVSHEFDRIALNNQSLELAKAWQLGEWASTISDDDFPEDQVGSAMMDLSERSRGSVVGKAEEYLGSPLTPPRRGTGLTSYRALLPSPDREVKPIHRSTSSPALKAIVLPGTVKSVDGDEPGVHGGEYSVRPNMQESMVFLRKLFTHQQGGAEQRGLFSPPDSPMLPNSLLATSKRTTALEPSLPKIRKKPAKREILDRKQLGVYILGAKKLPSKSVEEQELSFTKEVCLHNLMVCKVFGEIEKAEVWELLAQIVDSRLTEMGDAFDGWGGRGSGALGAGLVDTFLRYYETLGDVQMLSTMVCVLRGNRDKARAIAGGSRWSILPKGHDEKYDTYIRRYADLLYGWGALTIRAELNKHLVRVLPLTEAGQSAQGGELDDGRSPGIALVFTCPRCGNEAEFGTNICRWCQDYAFRCGLCDNAVRGLFTVCESCGHGGHVGHMKSWFESNNVCPSGCGCNCTFAMTPNDFAIPLRAQSKSSLSGRTQSPYIAAA